jgi:hypothetical protein
LSGGLLNAGIVALVVIALPFFAAAAWWGFTGAQLRDAIDTATRFFDEPGMLFLVVVLAVAWTFGILGWLGVGEIRPGWLTIGATAFVIGAAALGKTPVRRRLGWSE